MNTKRLSSKVYQCNRCDDTFMMIGSTVIGLAFPRKPGQCFMCAKPRIHPHVLSGTCPAHRRESISGGL